MPVAQKSLENNLPGNKSLLNSVEKSLLGSRWREFKNGFNHSARCWNTWMSQFFFSGFSDRVVPVF